MSGFQKWTPHSKSELKRRLGIQGARAFLLINCPKCHTLLDVKRDQQTRTCKRCGRRFWVVRKFDRIPPVYAHDDREMVRRIRAGCCGWMGAGKPFIPTWKFKEWEARATKSFSYQLNLNPSPELSYLVGVFLGDGYVGMRNRGYCVGLECKDEEFVDRFIECLSAVLGEPVRKRKRRARSSSHSDTFIAEKYSKPMFEFIKSENFGGCVEIYPRDFLRGVYDSEGCVNKLGKRISLSNTTLSTIQLTKNLLEKLGFHPRLNTFYHPRWKTLYSLNIGRANEVARFSEEIGFTIERKQRRLRAHRFLGQCPAARDNSGQITSSERPEEPTRSEMVSSSVSVTKP